MRIKNLIKSHRKLSQQYLHDVNSFKARNLKSVILTGPLVVLILTVVRAIRVSQSCESRTGERSVNVNIPTAKDQRVAVSREPARVHRYLDNRMIYLQRAATISEQDIIPVHRDGLYLGHTVLDLGASST